jgi:large subunit ribosomal protein L3
MVEGLIGIKVGMTQVHNEEGVVTPVTVIRTGPCVVVQRKTRAKEGYESVQLGLVQPKAAKKVSKPLAGHFKKSGVPPTRILQEFALAQDAEIKIGDQLRVELVFKTSDLVDVTGISKGKGFSGVVKRHHFRGGDATHGSMFHRAPGSIGGSSYPSRVFKGMRAAGRMGGDRVTAKNLRVMDIMPEQNLLLVSGAVPGRTGGYVTVRRISL